MNKLFLCFSVWLAVRRVDTPSLVTPGSQAQRGPGLGHAEPWEGVSDSSPGHMRLRLGSTAQGREGGARGSSAHLAFHKPVFG